MVLEGNVIIYPHHASKVLQDLFLFLGPNRQHAETRHTGMMYNA